MEVAALLIIVVPGLIIGFGLCYFFLSFFEKFDSKLILLSVIGGLFFGFIVDPVVGIFWYKVKHKRKEAYVITEIVYFKSALTGAFSEQAVEEHYRKDQNAMNTLEWHSDKLIYDPQGCLPSHVVRRPNPRMILVLNKITYSKDIKRQLSLLPEAPSELKNEQSQ